MLCTAVAMSKISIIQQNSEKEEDKMERNHHVDSVSFRLLNLCVSYSVPTIRLNWKRSILMYITDTYAFSEALIFSLILK